MSSRTNLAVSRAVLAPLGTPETRAQALRAIFGQRAARAAARFAMEAHEMGEDEAALAWLQAASMLVDDEDLAATPFLH
ncbi:MAG: hypothetical protein JWM77_814 [Rhodospirillales bacterium]|jgi:hypothetical protein|nr:hypothetical protein [Rhodospirillales bacterium]